VSDVRRIVCYGDSNTWGYDPATRQRFPADVRWTGVLARELGNGYLVVEEGLNGRTTILDDPWEPERNGKTYLRPCLESHEPLDLVTIMLGTNDLKARHRVSASDIAQGAAVLVDIAQHYARRSDGLPAAVLLICPPPVAELTTLDRMFEGAEAKSRELARYFRMVAEWCDVPLLDAGEAIVSSEIDGIHFEAAEHAKLGAAVAREIRRVLRTEDERVP
jgi:lysophospholipase L1-like esterase